MDGTWETRYALTGIRAATTAPQQALIDRATRVLRDDPNILAAWLGGSFALGNADADSDVDLHCCVPDDVLPSLAGDGWKDVLKRITPTVMATTFPRGRRGLCAHSGLETCRPGRPRSQCPPIRRHVRGPPAV